MVGARSRYGLFVSAVGAIVLAVSLFLPWYGVSFTASGLALAQHSGGQVQAQLDSASVQGFIGPGGAHTDDGALSGQQFAAASASHVLRGMTVVLLVLAGLAMLDALLPLARTRAPVPGGAGGSVMLLGTVAGAFALFRMLDLPTPAGDLLALSLREGAWLALLGSVTMVLGGMWPRCVYSPAVSDAGARGAWSGLSGWIVGG